MRQAEEDSGKQGDRKGYRVRRAGFRFLAACLFFLLAGALPKTAEASGASVSIASRDAAVTVGDTFYVVIRVSSADAVGGFEGYFTYDSRILKFVTGGSVVHGNDDAFRIDDTKRTEAAGEITYSVQFVARKAGSTVISMRKPYHVYAGTDGSGEMSISYNSLDLLVNKKKQAKPAQSAAPSAAPSVTGAPPEKTPSPTPAALPSANPKDVPGSDKLRKLKIKGADLAPAFAPDITNYSAIVTTDDKQVVISYEAKDSRADVAVKGNKNLKEGKNTVRVVVTGTDGSRTKYRISLNVQRTGSGAQSSRVTAFRKKGRLYLLGETQIEVLSAKEGDIPEGFEEREIVIDGKTVTAYALKGSREDSFALIYGRGDEEALYLYDIEEGTLYPYDKVRAWYRSMAGESSLSGSAQERTIQSLKYVIGIMAAFCGLMLLLAVFFGIRSRWR